jgi:hypothetical protein
MTAACDAVIVCAPATVDRSRGIDPMMIILRILAMEIDVQQRSWS